MANGNSHDRLTARIDALETRLADRSEHRDQEISALREIAADFEARIATVEKEIARQPTFFALWSPAIGTIAAVGALLWLVLTLRIEPLAYDMREATDEMTKQRERYGQMQSVDARQTTDIEWLKDFLKLLRERLYRLDDLLDQTRVEEANEH